MVIRSIDGIRIASTTSIQTLMQSDFDLVINDVTFRVATPPFQSSSTSSLVVDDEMKRMGDVRALVGQLYEVRNGVSPPPFSVVSDMPSDGRISEVIYLSISDQMIMPNFIHSFISLNHISGTAY